MRKRKEGRQEEQTEKFICDITCDDGDIGEFVSNVSYRLNIDNHYGEDADGNRGSRRVTVEVTDIEVLTKDDEPWKPKNNNEKERIENYMIEHFEPKEG